ncbi:MAG: hypothetical protein JNL61_15305 [Rhizobiaceae bacterium]|nr:hypothetical protein [Rhizobiaceae bacterium]
MAAGAPRPSTVRGGAELLALSAALLMLPACVSSAPQDGVSARNRAAVDQCRGEAWFCTAQSSE